jgi:hypothetical protein
MQEYFRIIAASMGKHACIYMYEYLESASRRHQGIRGCTKPGHD